MQDIIYKTNIFYNANNKAFEDIIPIDLIFETIEEPIIVMNTLNSCFSHAIIDSCFPIFWIIDDLLKAGKFVNTNIRIFIKENLILEYPIQNLPLIDEIGLTYNGVYKDIINLITPFPIFFQHILKKNYVFINCIFYPDNDKWQRTPWNCIDHYSGRNVSKNNVVYSDNIIYEKMSLFRNMVLTKIIKDITIAPTNNLMIVDRKYNRKIESTKLKCLIEAAEQNREWNLTGVVILEDKTFKEQVELFAKHQYFIVRHGSCLINLLWIPYNSIVFELEGGSEAPINNCYSRICKLTNSKHVLLNYDKYDCNKDIFDKLKFYRDNI